MRAAALPAETHRQPVPPPHATSADFYVRNFTHCDSSHCPSQSPQLLRHLSQDLFSRPFRKIPCVIAVVLRIGLVTVFRVGLPLSALECRHAGGILHEVPH